MRLRRYVRTHVGTLAGAVIVALQAGPAFAQDKIGDDIQKLQAVEVTGSRIKRAEVEGQTPILTITSKDIEATGLGSVGDIIQRLSVSGSSLNTKFNSAGNFGFPPDGGGVGSGSTTISLRSLGAKRTLILVDGLRWVNESSASGVSAAVDLNTIPASVVDRIEILKDGASSLYGSDAIAGVINIITKKKQDGLGLRIYGGDYSVGDGKTYSGNVSMGGSTDKFDFFMDISRFKQNAIHSSDWVQSRYPIPGVGSAPNRGWSSYTPTGRVDFSTPGGVDYGGLCPDGVCDITANGVAPPGGVQRFPDGYHAFGTADRFNYAPYNLLLTPQDRTGIFAQGTYHITDHVNFYLKGLYNSRDSTNQAAPEPIGLGQGFCQAIDLCYRVGVDASNPYNPFGFNLSADDPNFGLGRRPIEGGPRIYKQSVDTKYYAAGVNGDLNFADRQFFWDVNYVNSTNNATQTVTGTYNIRHIMNALGPVGECTAPCVPLNIFGGPGTITPEMLNYILFTENDRSKQKLEVWTANISGNLFQLPAGSLDIAAGYEHRKLNGSYTPDAVVTAGDSNGVPSGPTKGGYSVNEYYVELNAPLLADMAFAKHLDLSVATRYSDYSNFGSTTNSKLGLRWQLIDDLTLRGTWAEGFRAPSIGELFSTFSRFDAQLVDPCTNASGQIAANCLALGVPAGFQQANPQISIITGGNANLKPETSKGATLGAVYSPSWAENTVWSQRLDAEATYYRIKVENAIQAPNAQFQLNRCVDTLDPAFCNGITRAPAGAINGFNNTLRNLGRIDTSGFDLGLNWLSPEMSFGHFGANWQITYTKEYRAVASDTGAAEPTRVGVEVADSAVPRIRSTFTASWGLADWTVGWTLRYVSRLVEDCGNGASFPICTDPGNTFGGRSNGTHYLGATTYHDARVTWKVPMRYDFRVAAGINNIFGKDPPVCLSCSLNGYDASTYDLPGRFAYVEASVKF